MKSKTSSRRRRSVARVDRGGIAQNPDIDAHVAGKAAVGADHQVLFTSLCPPSRPARHRTPRRAAAAGRGAGAAGPPAAIAGTPSR
jgi:hypothetical protein